MIFEDFSSVSNFVLSHMIEWLKANKLVLTLEKIIKIKLETPNSSLFVLTIVYITFLVLQLGSHLNWKDHTDHMISTLSAACYAVRLMFHISNIITLKSIYFAYFHFIMQYGII